MKAVTLYQLKSLAFVFARAWASFEEKAAMKHVAIRYCVV
jgi:hypothetical protein